MRRLGLALEPAPGLAGWVDAERLDALFLHRPWGVEDAGLPVDLGILACHAPFDHRLTIGLNPGLARDLGIEAAEPFGEKDGRWIGMMGGVGPADPAALIARIREVLGGVEDVLPGRADAVRRIAVAGAMTDALVREAAARGAELYLTGQVRPPGLRAAAQTGIGIVAAGHRRGEEYGLRLLARATSARFGDAVALAIRPGGTGPAGSHAQEPHPPAPGAT